MGIFNYVEVDEKHIPRSEQCKDYQTKDEVVPLFMDTLRITENGRLMFCDRTQELREDDSAPLGVWLETIHEEWIDTNYHGDFSFYGVRGRDLIGYSARFTDGQLQYIKRWEGLTPPSVA